MAKYIGVDGCRSGWFTVIMDDRGRNTHTIYPTIYHLWEQHANATRILIDIPIGIPDAGERKTEKHVRTILKQRRSSVFSVPVREALYAETYTEASTINHRITGKKLSKQTWNITPKIREVDQFLRDTPEAQSIISESHPEFVFTILNDGQPMPHTKKTGIGFYQRLQVAKRHSYPQVDKVIQTTRISFSSDQLSDDDILDAVILAIGASIGNLKSIPENPEVDAYGLPMQVVYPALKEIRMSRILGIHHVQITIPPDQVDSAREFYCDVLNLAEIEKPDSLKHRGGFWLNVGDRDVHVGIEDGFDRNTTKAHIAYQVDDIDHWHDKLSKHGIIIKESIPIDGFKRFEFSDPFGNRIEMIQPTDE